jgi:hypothetical protein
MLGKRQTNRDCSPPLLTVFTAFCLKPVSFCCCAMARYCSLSCILGLIYTYLRTLCCRSAVAAIIVHTSRISPFSMQILQLLLIIIADIPIAGDEYGSVVLACEVTHSRRGGHANDSSRNAGMNCSVFIALIWRFEYSPFYSLWKSLSHLGRYFAHGPGSVFPGSPTSGRATSRS